MGEAIIGASVVEKGAPSNGTITDINGPIQSDSRRQRITNYLYRLYA